jgi:hypothetical protein
MPRCCGRLRRYRLSFTCTCCRHLGSFQSGEQLDLGIAPLIGIQVDLPLLLQRRGRHSFLPVQIVPRLLSALLGCQSTRLPLCEFRLQLGKLLGRDASTLWNWDGLA